MSDINFYNIIDEYGEFSNFYISPFKVGYETYKSVEHAFQSEKFADDIYKRIIIDVKTPAMAAFLGRQRINRRFNWQSKLSDIIEEYKQQGVILREDWEDSKVEVMMKFLRAKFIQNQECRELLLSTGNRNLVEYTTCDKFWGNGGEKNNGKNMLGICLMNIRNELRQLLED